MNSWSFLPNSKNTIEYIAQPVIPTNGTFFVLQNNNKTVTCFLAFFRFLLMFYYFLVTGLYLTLIKPVQFPLHEPYFDLTPIRITHTKTLNYVFINNLIRITFGHSLKILRAKLIAHTPFGAWRVVSTRLRFNSPWCGNSRLLVIPFSCSQVSDYN